MAYIVLLCNHVTHMFKQITNVLEVRQSIDHLPLTPRTQDQENIEFSLDDIQLDIWTFGKVFCDNPTVQDDTVSS